MRKMIVVKSTLITIFLSFIVHVSYAQISISRGGLLDAKEFSKDISLYRAKSFVIDEIIGQNKNVLTEFSVDPLVASSSGELTTLVYRCESLHKEGLILGFYGDRWNDAGVKFQSYAFKNIPIDEANELINKINMVCDNELKFMAADYDNNNVYFVFKDIGILIYRASIGIKLRIYWNGFDSFWQWEEFSRTKKRLIKKLK